MEWPQRFYEIRQGVNCPFCVGGRPDLAAGGVRFFAGTFTDAYLRLAPVQRGLSIVVWRGRHVSEPTQLSDAEATGYFRELLIVGRAIEQVMNPVKLNYDTLGNSVPHLHTHVVPRYADDPRPGWPFPFPDPEPPPLQPNLVEADLAALTAAALAGARTAS